MSPGRTTVLPVLSVLAVEGYRSLRRLVLPLGRLTVVTGPNGSGKSSLYRALRLLAETSRNGAVQALAREGGLASTLWAGPQVIGKAVKDGTHPLEPVRNKTVVHLRLGFSGDEFGYAIDLGLPTTRAYGVEPRASLFNLDPEIKAEAVWSGPVLRPATLLTQRGGPVVLVRGDDGWEDLGRHLGAGDCMLAEVADLTRAPEVLAVRERVRSWRFYDAFRSDGASPARQTRIGTFSPVLGPDGDDLAAVLQTLRELEEGAALDRAVDEAFPGSRVDITSHDGLFELRLSQPGLLRPLSAAELSDGTLRYLLWVGALLTPRPPALYVLNEPETSLHPDLLAPLARLIAAAAGRTQVVVVTHSDRLLAALEEHGATRLELVKEHGETRLVGQEPLDEPPWQWPKR